MQATITNRYSGNSTRVLLKVSAERHWINISARQYAAALRRIGAGKNTPVRTDTSFLVFNDSGMEVASLECGIDESVEFSGSPQDALDDFNYVGSRHHY